jgi:hypothetical protein
MKKNDTADAIGLDACWPVIAFGRPKTGLVHVPCTH